MKVRIMTMIERILQVIAQVEKDWEHACETCGTFAEYLMYRGSEWIFDKR